MTSTRATENKREREIETHILYIHGLHILRI